MPKQKSTYLGDELFEGREIISILKHLAFLRKYIYIKNIETQNEKQSFIRVLI